MTARWPVWIDKHKKVIFTKKTPGTTQICFKDRDTRLQAVSALAAKGYKIG